MAVFKPGMGATLGGSLLFATDNTYDIGASGATRARDLYLARNAVINGNVSCTDVSGAAATFTGALSVTGASALSTASLAGPLTSAAFSANKVTIARSGLLVIANSATATVTGAGSGLFVIQEASSSGEVALVLINGTGSGSGTTIVSQSAGNIFTNTSGTGSKVNVYLSGGVLTIQNNVGAQRSFSAHAFAL